MFDYHVRSTAAPKHDAGVQRSPAAGLSVPMSALGTKFKTLLSMQSMQYSARFCIKRKKTPILCFVLLATTIAYLVGCAISVRTST